MEECRFAADCVLFSQNLMRIPDVAFLMKERHCKRDYENCALFMIAATVGPERVPKSILPNQTAQARSIIEAALRTN